MHLYHLRRVCILSLQFVKYRNDWSSISWCVAYKTNMCGINPNKSPFRSAINLYKSLMYLANELRKPMEMNLEAIATDLNTVNKHHIRGAYGSRQLHYAFASGCRISWKKMCCNFGFLFDGSRLSSFFPPLSKGLHAWLIYIGHVWSLAALQEHGQLYFALYFIKAELIKLHHQLWNCSHIVLIENGFCSVTWAHFWLVVNQRQFLFLQRVTKSRRLFGDN